MAIYQLTNDILKKVKSTTFAAEGIKERDDLQRLLREQIDIISPNTLVIAEEFGDWEESRRRIDLLGVDKNANLVVIELKRSQDGGHMELQAIRYAAMVSTMTFKKAVDIYDRFLETNGKDINAESALLEFLEWDDAREDDFAQDVKIVLATAEFSKELMTSVIWLNTNGLDIRCVRLKPYVDEGNVYLDVQQVIPLPEVEEYQISIRDKSRKEKESRETGKDRTKYTIVLGDKVLEKLPKNRSIYNIVKYLCDSGVNPEDIWTLIHWKKNHLFQTFEGELDSETFEKKLAERLVSQGKQPNTWRYFVKDGELFYANGKTYAFDRIWGNRTAEAMGLIVNKYKDKGISFSVSDT